MLADGHRPRLLSTASPWLTPQTGWDMLTSWVWMRLPI